MHDGHNVFDQADSFLGVTWNIIEAYVKDKSLPEIIVVGLECAPGLYRLDEYSPFEFSIEHAFERQVGGKGEIYLEYIVNELKPMIDTKYRTLKAANDTAMMGSSMGGVISTYAAVKYPHVFSRIASLSGAFYVCFDKMIESIKCANLENIKKFYLDVGDSEVEGGKDSYFVQVNNILYLLLKDKINSNYLKFQMIEGAKHNEAEWAKRLPNILKYLFNN
jgi:predicted alpha/beta superfamily hydrolase